MLKYWPYVQRLIFYGTVFHTKATISPHNRIFIQIHFLSSFWSVYESIIAFLLRCFAMAYSLSNIVDFYFKIINIFIHMLSTILWVTHFLSTTKTTTRCLILVRLGSLLVWCWFRFGSILVRYRFRIYYFLVYFLMPSGLFSYSVSSLYMA